MRSTLFLTASALTAFASAQTFSDCNPTKKDGCPNNPAIAATFETNFKAGKDGVKGWKQTAGSLNYVAAGADFTIAKTGDAPTIQSEGYLHYGYVEVKTKAAPGQGIVSSIVLQSDDLDEVDWEWIGGESNKVQMNYFGKGDTSTYDRMIKADVANVQEVHTYAINWTADALVWLVDGQPMRTLKPADAVYGGGDKYPQTPCNVRIGIWAGGDSESEGTVQWAGGKVDYSKAPFTQLVESVKIINYSPGKEYQWTDKTGSSKSIKVIDAGNKDGAPQNSNIIQPSATSPGSGLGSEANHPTGTAAAGANTTCTDKNGHGPAPTSGPFTNGTAPCDCGILTVTLTGTPPPAESTPVAPPQNSTDVVPTPSTTAKPENPPVSVPISSTSPPSGIATDTNPAPSVPFPTNPSGAVPSPSGNGTVPAPPQFTGAAVQQGVSSLFGLAAAVMVLAF